MSDLIGTEFAVHPAPSLLFSVEARFVKLDRIGQVPEGERTNAHFLGDVEGLFGTGKLRGIDYSLKRDDGVVAIHVYEVFTSDDNYLIATERQGIGVPDGEHLLRISGNGWARTAQVNQAWLNDAPLVWHGLVDRQSGRLSLRIFVVKPASGEAQA